MYFGVSNGRYKSSQLPGRGRGPPPTPLTASSKMPPPGTFNLRAFSPRGGTGRPGGQRAEVLKSSFPKNPFHTVALRREKLPLPPNLSSAATFVSFEGGRMKGGGGRTRWEKGEEVTKEGIKGGGVLRSSFGVPLVCRERSPQGPGLGLRSSQARNRSCCSLGMGAGRKVQLAVAGGALPPGCESARQRRLPSRSALTPATRVSF